MSENDALSSFDFDKVIKPGKFLKFEAGKPVTLRILTKDPVISETRFGENLTTRLNFVVWNFTAEAAQILSTSFNMGKTFQRIGTDPDFGEDLQKCDIKISPEGEKLNRAYDINVLRHSGNEKELTPDQIKQCMAISLEKDVKDNKGRLSQWEPSKEKPVATEDDPDMSVEDLGGEAISLDDIPF